jgi:DNA-binding XRE family transcriptional regulator
MCYAVVSAIVYLPTIVENIAVKRKPIFKEKGLIPEAKAAKQTVASPFPGYVMDTKEFIASRKRLKKTQKDLANLLGISLKAVCSYEQGWRSIPGHVERQLIFLLCRKVNQKSGTRNCWEIRQCPDHKKFNCPAFEFDSGKFCWFISGTICDNVAHKNWDEKIKVCKKCEVLQKIK